MPVKSFLLVAIFEVKLSDIFMFLRFFKRIEIYKTNQKRGETVNRGSGE